MYGIAESFRTWVVLDFLQFATFQTSAVLALN